MSDIHIRKMARKDLHVIAKIESDCQSHPWTLLQFLDGFNSGHQGWILSKQFENREMVIGFAVVYFVLDECSLLNLCIKRAFQKQGYGRKLLKFLLEQAKKQKINKYYLEVRSSNMPAINLYESVGFKKVSTRKDYYAAFVGRDDGLVYSLSSLADVS